MNRRGLVVRVLLFVGVFFVAASLLVGYVHDTVADSSEFADRAQTAYASAEVREAITGAAVDQLIEAEPDLVAVQPLLETVIDGVLRTETAERLFGDAVRDLHGTVIAGSTDTVTVEIADLILTAKTQLTAVAPEAGALIPDELTDGLIAVEADPLLVDVVQAVDDLRVLALLLPLVAAAAFVGVVWLSPSLPRALVHVGLAWIVGAFAAVVTEAVVELSVVDGDGAHAATQEAIWDAYMNQFSTWALVVAGAGAVVAAVAWLGVGETDIGRMGRRLAVLVRRRDSVLERLLWGLGAMVVGALVIAQWQLTVRFLLTLVGAAIVAVGLRELVAVAAPTLVEGASALAALEDDEQPLPRTARDRRRWVTTVVLLLLGVGALLALDRSDDDGERATEGCNGDEALCSRRLDEIVVAATHNSHAAAAEGFTLGYQRTGIESQLDAGIRGLLIDVYFGRDVGSGVVTTDRAPQTEDERASLVAEVGESAVRAAEAVAADADASGIERELFLCHALCEIGASRFTVELGVIKRFIDDNPREVLQIIIQDEGPRPTDIAAAFESAGLLDALYAHQPGEPWPTLDELIEAGTTVVVFAENVSGEFPWYHDAFALIQDTPFSFERVTDFTCDLNRGDEAANLFLVNHWLSPVAISGATEANSAAVITDRFRACKEERGQLPTMIAVDFFSVGGVVETVLELNGL